jgi:methyl-accepting chemotaxis protein
LRFRLGAIAALSLGSVVVVASLGAMKVRDEMMEGRREKTREHTEVALGILQNFVALEESGAMTREEAQAAAADTVRDLRYNESDYFFSFNTDAIYTVFGPKPENEGVDWQGEWPEPLLRSLIETAQAGAGFYEYEFPKAGEDTPSPKVSYVAAVPEWGWVVGTGIYVDDVNTAFRKELVSVAIRTVLVAILLGVVLWFVVRAIRRTIGGAGQRMVDASGSLAELSLSLSAAAEEAQAQAQTVSEAATDVNAHIQTVAVATDELTRAVQEIASSATGASDVATSAVGLVESATAIVGKLGDSSAQIGEVVDVITSIAEQTNLLALNATIEAARAGESGKGFAVVANEVKELARQTAQATDVIGQKVAAIQADTGAAVTAIHEVAEVIGTISESQGVIAAAVEEQSAATAEIARTVELVARGASEIAASIEGVTGAAASTSEAASATHDAAGDLVEVSDELNAVVTG